MQTYLETQANLSALLERAREEGEVRIKRAAGEVFVLKPVNKKRSALDIKGIDLGILTKEIVELSAKDAERIINLSKLDSGRAKSFSGRQKLISERANLCADGGNRLADVKYRVRTAEID